MAFDIAIGADIALHTFDITIGTTIGPNEAIVREVRTAPAMIITAAPTVLEVRTAPAIIEVFHG